MNWFTKQVPSTSLVVRLNNQEVAAAVEYLQRFLDNGSVEQGRILQALALLVMDLDRGVTHE